MEDAPGTSVPLRVSFLSALPLNRVQSKAASLRGREGDGDGDGEREKWKEKERKGQTGRVLLVCSVLMTFKTHTYIRIFGKQTESEKAGKGYLFW